MIRLFVGVLVVLATTATYAIAAQDDERWFATPPEVRQWFQNLKQPDTLVSCCGEADAYYADSFKVLGDQYVAIITDERDDAPLKRPHVRPGTEILVPNHKLTFDQGNPTGHGVIFLRYDSEADAYAVLCYVAPGGG